MIDTGKRERSVRGHAMTMTTMMIVVIFMEAWQKEKLIAVDWARECLRDRTRER